MLEIMISLIMLPTHAYGGVVMALVSQKYRSTMKSEISIYPKIATLCGIAFVIVIGSVILGCPQIMKIITELS